MYRQPEPLLRSGTSVSQASLPKDRTERWRETDMELDMDIHTTPEGLLICRRNPSGTIPPRMTSPPEKTHPPPGEMALPPRIQIPARTARRAPAFLPSFPNGTSAYLYSLETAPALRRRGLAGCFLAQLIRHLERKGIRRICLQVSGSNEPALQLYRKTGFRITESPVLLPLLKPV